MKPSISTSTILRIFLHYPEDGLVLITEMWPAAFLKGGGIAIDAEFLCYNKTLRISSAHRGCG